MHRYGDIDRICDMPWRVGVQMIRKADEKETDEKLWQMWLVAVPYMPEDHRETFSEYKNRLLNVAPKKKAQTVEEQVAMCRLLNAAFGGEVVEM